MGLHSCPQNKTRCTLRSSLCVKVLKNLAAKEQSTSGLWSLFERSRAVQAISLCLPTEIPALAWSCHILDIKGSLLIIKKLKTAKYRLGGGSGSEVEEALAYKLYLDFEYKLYI